MLPRYVESIHALLFLPLLRYSQRQKILDGLILREGGDPMASNIPGEYAIAAAMLVVALLLGLLTLGLGRVMGPPRRPAEQNPSPEHGGRTGHKTWVQFRLRYAVLALLFVAFDMEMVFMFPWAVVFKRVGLVAFFDMFVFVAILTSAIFFAWKEGAFDWER
jgi:NADH-quinone oxidoreductase subunit A